MDKLIISPDFTIEDIHKIREYNYNCLLYTSDAADD